MARTGLYSSDVKKARDALLAQGRHPSVDAVRVALGNTGSKTTIHKYLKELETEEGAGGTRKVTASDALQDLVTRLAARLHQEADVRVDAAIASSEEKVLRQTQVTEQVQKELVDALARESALAAQLAAEQGEHEDTRARLQQEAILRHTAMQEAIGLKERLAENEQHRKSLEEKHTHARDALEHYRQSIKEQRSQEQRRHEQQVQQVQAELRQQQQALVAKQEEGTRLNQEGARLVAELSHVKQSLYEQLALVRKQEQKIEQLSPLHSRVSDLERQLIGKMAELDVLSQEMVLAQAKSAPAETRIRELELALAKADAREQMQQGIGDQLRSYLESMGTTAANQRACAEPGADTGKHETGRATAAD